MRTVLVYRSDLLPHSETFIKEQVLTYKTWRGILVGRTLLHQLSLDGLEMRLLEGKGRGLAARIYARLEHRLGAFPRPNTVRREWLDLLQKESPSLLHAHFGIDAVAAAPIAKALRIPMIVTLHGYDINIYREWWESGNGGSSLRRYPRRLLELAAQSDVHFIAVSNSIRERAIAYGIPADKVTTNYIGVDVSKFTPGPVPISERPPRVLFVGRLVEKKGCEYLLQAMQIVKARIPSAELTVVGDGSLRADLTNLSARCGLNTRFVGVASAAEVKNEFDQARIFCLPSITAESGDAEGLPISVLEAQACGLPVVTSARGCFNEGVRELGTGFVLPERDTSALAHRLETLLTDDILANEMSKCGPSHIANIFDIKKCTGNLENLYDNIARVS